LIIKKNDSQPNGARETLDEEIAVILPFYERKRLQLVPVGNFVFQSKRQAFTLENGVVRSVADDDAKFEFGTMLLCNIHSFGEYREYGLGIGLGYSLQPGGKSSSFLLGASVSFKDIFRVGFGYGYTLSPAGLTGGAKVDAPLPANISNLGDVVEYKRRSGFVISIALPGIKF
ncbi:MAG: hypothetical protein JO301_08440, partial [Chitinophagaceae bacterium]|nr:hypothetical protein [Chitinophagaceae bacterium]